MASLLGTDLAVVPQFVAHDAAVLDLRLRRYPARRTRPGLPDPELADLATLSERENLAQALILRLLTPRGALTELGHSGYGSRLHELIGRNKTAALRNLCRAFVLEAVAQEPRVEDTALDLTFDELAETASSFVFTLSVQPHSGEAPVGLTLEVGL